MDTGKKARDRSRDSILRALQNGLPSPEAEILLSRVYRALDIARETLVWSYPYVFLMDKRLDTCKLLEISQANLETITEKVSALVELSWDQPISEVVKFVKRLEHETSVLLRQADSFSV
jgi:hypothetical protein